MFKRLGVVVNVTLMAVLVPFRKGVAAQRDGLIFGQEMGARLKALLMAQGSQLPIRELQP